MRACCLTPLAGGAYTSVSCRSLDKENGMLRRTLVAYAVLLAAISVLAPLAAVEEGPARHGRLIRLEVLTPHGQVAKGIVQEGQLFELKDLAAGTSVGFAPVVQGESIVVQVFALDKEKGLGGKRLLEEISAALGENVDSTKTEQPYRVKIVHVEGMGETRRDEIQEAYTVPLSSRLVRMEVTLPSGNVAKGVVQEGQVFRVKAGAENLTYGFAPILKGNAPTVKVYEIRSHTSGHEMIRLLEELSVAVGESAAPRKVSGSYEVKIIEEVKDQAECDRSPLQKRDVRSKAVFSCCVKCGDEEACGCAASLGCGSCCSGPCCGSDPLPV